MTTRAVIPFLKPNVPHANSYASLLDVIDESGIYTNFGPVNSRFESTLRERFFGARGYLSTICNATIGLMLAIKSVARPAAPYAILPSFTFAATPLAVQWCGLIPYFVDVRPDDWCSDPEHFEEAINTLGEDQVAVLVPCATFGNPF